MWDLATLCGRQWGTANKQPLQHLQEKYNRYGGSLLLIKKDVISEPVDIQSSCDVIFRKIQCSDTQTLINGSAYRPTNHDTDYDNELVKVIQKVCHKHKDAVVWLAGYFHLPDIDWSRNTITGQKRCQQGLPNPSKWCRLTPDYWQNHQRG